MIRSVTACSLAFFSHIAFSDTLEERSINAQLHTNNFLQECSKNVSMIINKAKKGLVGLGPSDDPDCSGFFIDIENGYIVTSQHCLPQDSTLLDVTVSTDHTYSAIVVGSDVALDLALLKISDSSFDKNGLVALDFEDSDQVKQGAVSIVLGAPYGYTRTAHFGIVSATKRK